MAKNGTNSKRGFSLFELMLVMSVAGAWAVSEHRSKVFEMEQQQAKLAGVEAFKYNNAVRRYLAEFSPSGDISTIHRGIKWLQSKEKCGGEIVTGDPKKEAFLSCDFKDKTTFGRLEYLTKVDATVSPRPGGTMDIRKKAETILYSKSGLHGLPLKGSSREDLAGVAAFVVAGGSLAGDAKSSGASSIGMTSDGYSLYCISKPDESKLRSECKGDIGGVKRSGHIVMTTGNDQALDTWLRRDGGNQMVANLGFSLKDGAPDYAITGLSALIPKLGVLKIAEPSDGAKGHVDIAGKLKFLDDIHAGGAAEIDGHSTLSGGATIKNGAEISGGANIQDGLTVKGGIKLDQGNLDVEDSVTIEKSLTVNGSARFKDVLYTKKLEVEEGSTFGGTLTVEGLLTALDGIKVHGVIEDGDNADYFVDPDDKTSLKDLSVDTLTFNHSGWQIDKDLLLTNGDAEFDLPESLMADIGTVNNGTLVAKPACADGYSPRIYTSLSQITSDQGSPLGAYSIQTYADSVDALTWKVNLRYYGYSLSGAGDTIADSLNWVTPKDNYARIQVITRCIRN